MCAGFPQKANIFFLIITTDIHHFVNQLYDYDYYYFVINFIIFI